MRVPRFVCQIVLTLLLGILSTTAAHADTMRNTASVESSVLPPSGLSFYVAATGSDTNDGSAAAPWRTIQYAVDRVVPGATVYVSSGTYEEAIVSRVSGNASAPVRFVSTSKWGAKIVGSAEWVWHNTGDYVDIEGFEVTTSVNSQIGIYNQGSFVRVIGNHVHHIPAANYGSDGGAGIDTANAHQVDIIGNVVHDIGDMTVNDARVQGIYHSHKGGLIQNNIVYRIQSFGIHLWHSATDITIANNLIFRTLYGGILVGSSSGVADNCIVINNIVYDNPRHGIREGSQAGANNRYLNNLVYENGTNWSLVRGSDSGTVAADPQFVNYQPDGTGDYRLSPLSPAIGAGTSEGAPPTDFDGVARPQGYGLTVGPYERP